MDAPYEACMHSTTAVVGASMPALMTRRMQPGCRWGLQLWIRLHPGACCPAGVQALAVAAS